jgi:hypothetical protein
VGARTAGESVSVSAEGKTGRWCGRLLCRVGDEQAMEELRRGGAQGPEWEWVAAHLVDYALRVLHHQHSRQTLAREANTHRRAAALHPVVLAPEDAQALDADPAQPRALFVATCSTALDRFRRIDVVGGHWRPGGRPVPGYYVTRCYFVLGDELTTWRRVRTKERKVALAAYRLAEEDERLGGGDVVEDLREADPDAVHPLIETMR